MTVCHKPEPDWLPESLKLTTLLQLALGGQLVRVSAPGIQVRISLPE